MLHVGSKAPDFKLKNQNNRDVSLEENLGCWILIYFYPKDDTLFCIKEACSIRDNYDCLVENNVKVFGINQDSVESHKQFVEKYNLKHSLLSDPSKDVIKMYKANGFFLTKRISYLINAKGYIEKIFPIVNSFMHAKDVLHIVKKKIIV